LTGRHLGRDETDLYKGVGILLIVLHNYFHWVRPSTGENEFNFSRRRTVALLDGLWQQPLESINLLFDYFGHYGVQVFVVLSAYGLARAYPKPAAGWLRYMARRLAKIYPAFLLAVLAHLLFVVTLWNEHLAWFFKVYALKLSGLSAFVPHMQFSLVGPWWFFSFIVQFYAVFPLLRRVDQRFGTRGLVAVGAGGLAVTTAANPYLLPNGLNLYLTVIGHLPVLCLGLYLARTGLQVIDRRAGLAAGVILALALGLDAAWLFAPIAVTILFLLGLPRLLGLLRRWPPALRFVSYCGAISLPLFAIHGMMRTPFTQFANQQANWLATLLIAAAFLAAALAAAQVLSTVESAGRRWLARARSATA
jgi:peptidoglycan/LPS O-acetylase OafA/YrhL